MDILARLANLPGALPGACAQGLIWGIMAIGVYLTYRILDVADLTVDGSFGTGGAVCVMCLLSGMNVWAALFIALLAGLATGLVTGLLHTFMGIPAILAGILTQLALYSINLKIITDDAEYLDNGTMDAVGMAQTCLLYTSISCKNTTYQTEDVMRTENEEIRDHLKYLFDGSHYPFEENLAKSTELVNVAHQLGLSIECEVPNPLH